MLFLFLCRGDRIIETHRVHEMPHTRPPYRGKHSVAAMKILLGKCSHFFCAICWYELRIIAAAAQYLRTK